MPERFFVKTDEIDDGPGIMRSLRASVFDTSPAGPVKIGEYMAGALTSQGPAVGSAAQR